MKSFGYEYWKVVNWRKASPSGRRCRVKIRYIKVDGNYNNGLGYDMKNICWETEFAMEKLIDRVEYEEREKGAIALHSPHTWLKDNITTNWGRSQCCIISPALKPEAGWYAFVVEIHTTYIQCCHHNWVNYIGCFHSLISFEERWVKILRLHIGRAQSLI